jgi:ankyrin repeat protein
MKKLINVISVSILVCGQAPAMEPASVSSLAMVGQTADQINQIESLCNAARNGNLKLTQEFLAHDVPVDAQDNDGWTALRLAAAFGHKEVCQLLIHAKAQVNTANIQGTTALIFAANKGHKEVCQLLIDAQAQLNAKDNYGWTALVSAAYRGHNEVCQLLINAKAQADAKCRDGKTALMCAAANGQIDTCHLLIDAMLKPIKDNRAAATALLGMKKFNKTACMRPIDRNVIQAIAHQIYNPAAIQQLFAQIDASESEYVKNNLATHAQQQLKLKMQSNTNHKRCIIA